MHFYTRMSKLALATCITFTASHVIASDALFDDVERVSVYADKLFQDTTEISPTSSVGEEVFESINLVTAEDVVALEPSIVIRRRYVGDPNGSLGIRGSGMFQTARSLVFADGLPLHYLLQTRWSGAPRWSLVGPDEIKTADVIYGPFSAEYSGNAMGGVVNITTRNPEKQRFVALGTLMSQQYDELGTDDSFNGNRLYFSYEDTIGDLGYFVSYNRLNNKSHPMTNYSVDQDNLDTLIEQGISGYVEGLGQEGDPVIYIGDSGAETSVTELYKTKLVYTLPSAELRATIAYESRTRDEDDKRNYLVDVNGNNYWGLGNINFEERAHERDSLLVGLGLSGDLGNDWAYDVYATDFDLRKDEERRSGLNTNDPNFGERNGRLTQYDDTGWNTLDIKVGTQRLFNNDNMRLSVGAGADRYTLSINPFNIDAITGDILSERSKSRGETRLKSLFVQYGWALNEQWDVALGGRWEEWETRQGFYNDTRAEERSDSGFSPKFSLAFMPTERWKIRYSVAKALRFPIAEELYSNEAATTSIVISDPTLGPEDGIFHNMSFERLLDDGALTVNLFQDAVDDTIYYQRGVINDGDINVNVNTFLAIDEVKTRGAEFSFNKTAVLYTPLNVRFNVTYTDASIEENNANPSIEGNTLPRIPKWRANMLLSYDLTEFIDVNVSARYASKSYGTLDNTDVTRNVYGSQDNYLFVNVRSNWHVTERVTLSAGIDNLFDELAYVAHPWPLRTFFLEAQYVFEQE